MDKDSYSSRNKQDAASQVSQETKPMTRIKAEHLFDVDSKHVDQNYRYNIEVRTDSTRFYYSLPPSYFETASFRAVEKFSFLSQLQPMGASNPQDFFAPHHEWQTRQLHKFKKGNFSGFQLATGHQTLFYQQPFVSCADQPIGGFGLGPADLASPRHPIFPEDSFYHAADVSMNAQHPPTSESSHMRSAPIHANNYSTDAFPSTALRGGELGVRADYSDLQTTFLNSKSDQADWAVDEEKRSEIERLLLQKCKLLCTKGEKEKDKEQDAQPKPSQEHDNFEDLEHVPMSQVAQLAETSLEDSKRIQAYMQRFSEEQLAPMIDTISRNLDHYIRSKTACYIPRDLIPMSATFASLCRRFCLANLLDLLSCRFAGHVLRKLADSADFCREAILLCEQNFKVIVRNLQSTLVLASFVKKAPDEDCLEFLITELETQLSTAQETHFLRILTNLIERATGKNLMRIQDTINANINWLMDDGLGNFGIQALFRRRSASTINSFIQVSFHSPIVNLFVKKHRKYVFLEAVRTFENEHREFLLQVLRDLMKNTSGMRLLFKYEDSSWLFIALLFRLQPCSEFLQKIKRRVVSVAKDTIQPDLYKHWRIIARACDQMLAANLDALISDLSHA
jgi:hypothetical protein